MKKIIAMILVLALVLSLAGCTTSTSSSFTTVWGKADVYEVSTYKISVYESDTALFVGAPNVTGEGTYTSTISGNYIDGFVLETVLEFVGEFEFDGKTEDFIQTTTSIVEFGDTTTNLAPTYSKKTSEGSTITYDSETGTFAVAELNYITEITYEDSKAYVSISDFNGNAIADSVATESEIKLSSSYYDNEQLFLYGRSLVKSSGDQTSFSIVSPINGLTEMALYVSEESDDVDTSVTMEINGSTATYETHSVQIMINSTFNSGYPIYLLYAKDDTGNVSTAAGNSMSVDKSRLLQFTTQVPYTNSFFLYEMTDYSSNME